jgi:aminopeptidase N
MSTQHNTIYLKDYTPPLFYIPTVDLHITLSFEEAIVTSTLTIKKNHDGTTQPLVLNGEHIELLEIELNGAPLSSTEYSLTDSHLTLDLPNETNTLKTKTKLSPEKNLALEGIYKSDNIICSQNEPEGFRRITYFIDRPDIMSEFTTTLTAKKKDFPILLSNGNLIDSGENGDTHFTKWHDPFPKPAYLFAVVAGDLGKITDSFTTKSGRTIPLEIYTDKGNEDRCWHAMESLKKSMKWDEDVYGLEYDLDIFMIVAVDAFNMGAMENKGLNIFNAAYILADPKTATDNDYKGIEAVVAHEYFHNWTGNRVTCRDWFQLTLKEGLTVFRDQEFSSDMNSRTVERIQNVRRLREAQFTEDAGPMAHPIRPESYVEINNFYTATVYEKGSEIIRMIHTLIGPEKYRKGIDIYFENFDGQAVTTEDFLWAMSEASGYNFSEFKRWYNQAGTPHVNVTSHFDSEHKTYTLTFEQTCRKTPETANKKPFHFPIKLGLIDNDGSEIATRTVIMSKETHTEIFENIEHEPTPSLLRDFSAPVVLHYPYTNEALTFLANHDTDPFNQYEAMYRLSKNILESMIHTFQSGDVPEVPASYLHTIGTLLENADIDNALKAEMLSLPSVSLLVEDMEVCDFDSAFKSRELLIKTIAHTHAPLLNKTIAKLKQDDYKIDAKSMGERRLKNTCLALISNAGCDTLDLVYEHFKNATNMTDQLSSLATLIQHPSEETKAALNAFYTQWKDFPLIMNKWIGLQMLNKNETVFDDITTLQQNPVYDDKNPNKCRALIGSFVSNLHNFHHISGRGYAFLRHEIQRIDAFNPSIAARLSYGFKKYKKLDPVRKDLMRQELEQLLNSNLSKNTSEIISKIAKDN